MKDLYSSYKDLPLAIYQIQDKYRDEARPRAGLLRGREFTMKDAYSFDYTDEGLDASYQAQRDAYERIFQRLGLEYVIVHADNGLMGGARSEEFLHPIAVGEDTFVRSAGGYAANVEAFTTIVPDADPVRRAAATPVIFDSPNTPTIQTLVDHSNAHLDAAVAGRRGDEWTAAHTLKNVVLALTHLDGTRELVDRRHPGRPRRRRQARRGRLRPRRGRGRDRGGLRAQPATSSRATSDPGPRPARSSARSRRPASATSSTRASSTAPSWITGANIDQKHVHSLVAGRDFTGDGFVEVANVRAGDPAPDGSGPVELARGMEIGHVFQLGRFFAETLGLKVLDENGKLVTVTMGSYGIGVTRILAILAELNNDEKGLVWPASVAPFDVHVVATGRDAVVFDVAEQLSADLEAAGLDVLYDDRPKVSPGVKFGDAELVGVPRIVIVGRGAADGQVELWDRRTGDRELVSVADAVEAHALALSGLTASRPSHRVVGRRPSSRAPSACPRP